MKIRFCFLTFGLVFTSFACGTSSSTQPAPNLPQNQQPTANTSTLECDWQKAFKNPSTIKMKNIQVNTHQLTTDKDIRIDFEVGDSIAGLCLGYNVQHLQLVPEDQMLAGIDEGKWTDTIDFFPAIQGSNETGKYFVELRYRDLKKIVAGNFRVGILNIYGIDSNSKDIQHIRTSEEESSSIGTITIK